TTPSLPDALPISAGHPAVPVLHLPAAVLRRAGRGVPVRRDACAALAVRAQGLGRAGAGRGGGRRGLRRAALLGAAASAGDADLRPRPELPGRAAFLAGRGAQGPARHRRLQQHRLAVPRPEHADVVPAVVRRAWTRRAVCRFQATPSPSVPPVTVAAVPARPDDAVPHPVTVAMSPVSAVPAAPQPSPARWSPDSWRTKPALQLPQYPDAGALAAAQDELRAL